MELDLEKVKVRYSVKEIIVLISLLVAGVTQAVRTELEFIQVKDSLARCEKRVDELQKPTKAEMDYLKCAYANAGPPCIPAEEKK
jgi:hypothetical protein